MFYYALLAPSWWGQQGTHSIKFLTIKLNQLNLIRPLAADSVSHNKIVCNFVSKMANAKVPLCPVIFGMFPYMGFRLGRDLITSYLYLYTSPDSSSLLVNKTFIKAHSFHI